MIPKVIHYCWFGRNPKSTAIKNYINTWKNVLCGYEIVEWNETNFDVNSTVWTKEAMDCRKYAFVSDYVRLKVLYEHGGIYLDTDVEVLKSFDALLDLPYFIGAENTIHGINTATIGVEAYALWIKQCLNHYSGRHFLVNGRMDMRVNPELIKDSLLQHGYDIKYVGSLEEFSRHPGDFCVFPSSWFSPLKRGVCLSDQSTFTIHHYAASWGNKLKWRQRVLKKIKEMAKSFLPTFVTQYILKKKKEKRNRMFDC